MSSKRRKLDAPGKSPMSAVSAFAARKAQAAAQSTGGPEKETPSSQPRSQKLVPQVKNDVLTRNTKRGKSGQVGNAFPAMSPDLIAEGNGPGEDLQNHISSHLKPSEDNTKALKSRILVLKLAPGEFCLGNVILRLCPDGEINPAVLHLHQSDRGMRSLESLSPLFGKLWNEDAQVFGSGSSYPAAKIGKSTFQIVGKSCLRPVTSPPEWNKTLAKLSNSIEATKRIMLCGPKSSGKSTFVKLLVNRLLSTSKNESQNSTSKRSPGVALLDLDPGQPEYSHPGQISLIHIQEPNFGSSITHPIPGIKSRLVRAHSLGAVSPSLDPSLYISCALDLFAHYCNLSSLHFNCPLVINTPGWVFGTGLEILVDLIVKVHPTEVIYMSKTGPSEVIESLQDAAKTTPLTTLPSQTSEFMTRTSAHLRTMQSMSYFHLDSSNKNELVWNGTPLTSVPPWEIKYSGENAGVLGIMCYGEQPPPELLAETINGSIVSVVVIDDPAAIPGHSPLQHGHDEISDPDPDPDTLHTFNSPSNPDPIKTPLIIPTPHEKLPYFNPLNAITVDPKFSQSIGTALVRGIDAKRQRLQVLTPITPELLEEINQDGKKIVLISGKLDTPGWAYTEELMKRTWLEKEKRRKELGGGDEDEDEDSDVEDYRTGTPRLGFNNGDITFHNAPWVEKLTGSQGRGIGARVWRVRRDLGKMGDAN
ncbi:hypothetical protein EYC80_007394 [Monilinia laxa]|uniref:Polynucleotide 5'-hydroxyl-kinase GRC3 n=1 Tax=Monilinia laxa TaxID=61186 RepID=A0A5N6JUI9_MONLA|nr:hypothetical protein EYC80_007394 [Monilinia laxa]